MEKVTNTFETGFETARFDLIKNDNQEVERVRLMVGRDGGNTTVSQLSEGERELIGIIVAIAGHRTYNVSDAVPAILIDGIGQLSDENLELLTEYLKDASEVLVTTAYPEAGDFGENHVSPDEWTVISDQEAPAA
jgi:DNA repair exonuclease SbcCD ATPase subunit